VNNDPVNWVDPWGLFTFQIGISATAGGGTGGTIEAGLIVARDPENPFSIEVGTYSTKGLGAQHYGVGASVGLNITTSTNSKASDMAGSSVVSGGSATLVETGIAGVTVGAETVISLEGKNTGTTASISLSRGTTYEAHTFYTETKTNTTTVGFGSGSKQGGKGK
jgi:hypothetical protein